MAKYQYWLIRGPKSSRMLTVGRRAENVGWLGDIRNSPFSRQFFYIPETWSVNLFKVKMAIGNLEFLGLSSAF